MLVRTFSRPESVKDTIEYYEAQGLSFLSKKVLNRESIELSFSTSGKEHAFIGSDDSVETFIEFEDGSISPLYIRRDRDFSE
jgi:hypothetical protein